MLDYGEDYAFCYAWFWNVAIRENSGLPVEKPNFSTISTDLSTGLFHRKDVENIQFRFT
jgi:hypothetical protein